MTSPAMTRLLHLAVLACVAFVPLSCGTLEQIANLRRVDFALDSATNVRLAGVDVSRYRNYSDLNPLDIARVGAALATRQLPLSFTLNVGADNPNTGSNAGARLVAFDWTLLLDEQETVSGAFNQEVYIAPGTRGTIPLRIDLDLYQFFNKNAQEFVNLALALSGQDGVSTRVKLRARPTINTPLGALRYPEYITVVSRTVGN
jgi:hypothetical protein